VGGLVRDGHRHAGHAVAQHARLRRHLRLVHQPRLAAFGAPREVATAFALSAHAVLWAPVTAVGLALLAWQGGASAFRPDSPTTAPRGAAAQ
jgi:hypothetical protein